ncbi:gamma-glutamyltranspeptidase/glutathione hydrolase [Nocardioides zeae]|uniref:Gamma-glutamyltranspeptidase/glutathione hydrolase n=1 Tax=Nocardioides zeae TaxID=1457234 RepID=A0AAJ1U877_9ACTN|nr:gamma-glutamyltranspeptidase/glutathione hydrolase [Nocardioides zeae]
MSSSAFTPPPADLTRPTLTGSFGMAAGTHWLAAASAQSVLERGGNAFDAAVAGAFVLHAVEPHLNGPGGDLMGIVAPAGADPVVVDGQGPAPAGATIAHLRAEGLDDVPGSGALAAAVPAAVEALLRLLEDHGTWELGDVLAPAVHYLEDGHPAGAQLCRTIATMRDHFTDHWPDSAALWLVDGRVPEPGDVVRNPAYAATLRALVAAGTAATADLDAGTDEEARVARIRAARAEWRSGRVGQALVTGAGRPHRHSSGTDHAGVLALADLAADHVRLAEPLTLDFRGTTVHKAGFSSQGPVLLQCLAILDQLPDERLDPSTALGAHTVLEVLKLALADRDAYYGSGADPAVLAHLLTPAYAAERAALVGETASLEHRPGVVPGATPFAPPLRTPADVVVTGPRGPGQPGPAPVGVGEPTVARHGTTRGDTCHLDVVDAAGQPGGADAVGRVAAVVADDPRAGLLPRHAPADDVARRVEPLGAAPRRPAAHDAQPDGAEPRRTTVRGARHARRRPAGPVAAALPPAAPRRRVEPAGRHRRARLPHHRGRELVLAAHLGAGWRRRGGPPRGGGAGRAARAGTRADGGGGLDARTHLHGRSGPGDRLAVRCGQPPRCAGVRRRSMMGA